MTGRKPTVLTAMGTRTHAKLRASVAALAHASPPFGNAWQRGGTSPADGVSCTLHEPLGKLKPWLPDPTVLPNPIKPSPKGAIVVSQGTFSENLPTIRPLLRKNSLVRLSQSTAEELFAF